MGDIFFIMKSFLLTIFLVILLQVRVGGRTIEDRAMTWIETSSITRPLHRVVAGGATFIRDIWASISQSVEKTLNGQIESPTPGDRSFSSLDRRPDRFSDRSSPLDEPSQKQLLRTVKSASLKVDDKDGRYLKFEAQKE